MLLFAVLAIVHASGCRSAESPVLADAPKPTLRAINSLHSSTLVDWVTFTCIAPGPEVPRRFMLYKDGMNLQFTEEVGNSSVMAFEIKLATVYNSGNYFCQYQTSNSTLSMHSDYVQLIVTELVWPLAVGLRLMVVFILHIVVLATWLLYSDDGKDPKIQATEMKVFKRV
ncbi:uncharacterized protein LOC144611523 [Rhinoraja longicauda]